VYLHVREWRFWEGRRERGARIVRGERVREIRIRRRRRERKVRSLLSIRDDWVGTGGTLYTGCTGASHDAFCTFLNLLIFVLPNAVIAICGMVCVDFVLYCLFLCILFDLFDLYVLKAPLFINLCVGHWIP